MTITATAEFTGATIDATAYFSGPTIGASGDFSGTEVTATVSLTGTTIEVVATYNIGPEGPAGPISDVPFYLDFPDPLLCHRFIKSDTFVEYEWYPPASAWVGIQNAGPSSAGGSGGIVSVNGYTGPSVSLVMSDIPFLVSSLAGKESAGTASAAITALGLGTASTHSEADFEPALGKPAISGQVLSKTTDGTVSWIAQSSGGGGSGSITSVNGQTGPSITLAMSDIAGLVSGLAGKDSSGTASALISNLHLGSSSTQPSNAYQIANSLDSVIASKESAGVAAGLISNLQLGTASTQPSSAYQIAGSLDSTIAAKDSAGTASALLSAHVGKTDGTAHTISGVSGLQTALDNKQSLALATTVLAKLTQAYVQAGLIPYFTGTDSVSSISVSSFESAGNVSAAISNLHLGTASTCPSTQFATSAQGSLAASALQPAGSGASLTGITAGQIGGLGSSATTASSSYDTAGAAATVQSASLQKSNNLSDMASAISARSNLGLGSSATQAQTFFLTAGNNLSDVTPATARTNLGLGTASTQGTAAYILASNNLSDVPTKSTARTNLGLGSASTQATTAYLLTANNLSDVTASTARTNLGLGTAATQGTSAYILAGSLGTASTAASTQFATSAQGTLAATAMQTSASIISVSALATQLSTKASISTTLAGYGITDGTPLSHISSTSAHAAANITNTAISGMTSGTVQLALAELKTIASAGTIPSGSVIQTVYATYSNSADITSVIPVDDTKPQISEGLQIFSQSITLSSASNKVRVTANGACGSTQHVTGAIFNGATDSIQSLQISDGAGSYPCTFVVEITDTPGSASVTYSFRVGVDSGSAKLGGTYAARLYGGAAICGFTLEEIKA